MRHAVINPENKVVNVILWDGVAPWRPPFGHIAVPAEDWVGIGHSYDPLRNAFSVPELVQKG